MLAEGLWSPVRKLQQHRKRRDRRAHFGELVQLDGSFHDWYQGRGLDACLMNMVDDATSTVEARLGDQETIWAAAHVLRQWSKYGVPLALYTDWKNVYLREPTPKELLDGVVPVTQFRMCGKLDIRIIAANSPQAKGRVERGNGTHQDRLIKKMGLKGIGTHEAANRYLQEDYLSDHNQRFAREAAEPQDYHRKAPGARELEQVFCLETERTISNDWVVRYDNRYFQLKKESGYAPARSKVTVCEWENGKIAIRYRDRAQTYGEIAKPAAEPREESKPARAQHRIGSPRKTILGERRGSRARRGRETGSSGGARRQQRKRSKKKNKEEDGLWKLPQRWKSQRMLRDFYFHDFHRCLEKPAGFPTVATGPAAMHQIMTSEKGTLLSR